MLKIIEIGRFQIFISRSFFFGYNIFPKKYMLYKDKDGNTISLTGGIYKVYYFGWLEIRIYNQELYKKSKEAVK